MIQQTIYVPTNDYSESEINALYNTVIGRSILRNLEKQENKIVLSEEKLIEILSLSFEGGREYEYNSHFDKMPNVVNKQQFLTNLIKHL